MNFKIPKDSLESVGDFTSDIMIAWEVQHVQNNIDVIDNAKDDEQDNDIANTIGMIEVDNDS